MTASFIRQLKFGECFAYYLPMPADFQDLN